MSGFRKRKNTELSCDEDSDDEPWRAMRASGTVPICTVGIDFGTARTGYAFAFKSNSSEIICKEPGGQEAVKTNTALLLDARGRFIAFGSKALKLYYEDEGAYLLFEKFKMNLHTHHGGEAKAEALNGTKLPLIDVISKTLEFVKMEALAEINKTQLADIKLEQIQWVVTVPAIWSDIGKAAMRRAALQAGMIKDECSHLLELALEPEAACVACEDENANLKKGDTFMVLDCGGGTVDITMHRVAEKQPDLRLEEIHEPSGGPWGSTFVDSEFEQFIKDLIGQEAFRRFKPSSHWVELMGTWEGLKLGFEPGQDAADEVTKSINVNPVLEVVENATLKDLVDKYNLSHGTKLGVRGKSTLLLPTTLVQTFFNKVISKIIMHATELLKEKDVKYIFLVGGFAESRVLLHRIKNAFERDQRRVVSPLRPGLAVVKGAVMLGLGATKRFTTRMARNTYGVDCAEAYDATIPEHRVHRTFTQMQGGVMVKNVADRFQSIVKQGSSIACDKVHCGEPLHCLADGHYNATLKLFTSTNPSANWTTDVGMTQIGTITVPCCQGDKVRVDLCFGQSEIRAYAVNMTKFTRTPATIKYDFRTL